MQEESSKKTRTTQIIRQKIKFCKDGTTAAAERFNVHPNTIRRWRARENMQDLSRKGKEARAEFVQDLEILFAMAIENGHYHAALRAKEILGKEAGFFSKNEKRNAPESILKALSAELSTENLEQLMNALLKNNHNIICEDQSE